MKHLLILLAILFFFDSISTAGRAEELDKADKTEIKRLNILVKILVDRLAANKINELLSENDSISRESDQQSLLQKIFGSNHEKKKKQKVFEDRVVACESEELSSSNFAC